MPQYCFIQNNPFFGIVFNRIIDQVAMKNVRKNDDFRLISAALC